MDVKSSNWKGTVISILVILFLCSVITFAIYIINPDIQSKWRGQWKWAQQQSQSQPLPIIFIHKNHLPLYYFLSTCRQANAQPEQGEAEAVRLAEQQVQSRLDVQWHLDQRHRAGFHQRRGQLRALRRPPEWDENHRRRRCHGKEKRRRRRRRKVVIKIENDWFLFYKFRNRTTSAGPFSRPTATTFCWSATSKA